MSKSVVTQTVHMPPARGRRAGAVKPRPKRKSSKRRGSRLRGGDRDSAVRAARTAISSARKGLENRLARLDAIGEEEATAERDIAYFEQSAQGREVSVNGLRALAARFFAQQRALLEAEAVAFEASLTALEMAIMNEGEGDDDDDGAYATALAAAAATLPQPSAALSQFGSMFTVFPSDVHGDNWFSSCWFRSMAEDAGWNEAIAARPVGVNDVQFELAWIAHGRSAWANRELATLLGGGASSAATRKRRRAAST